jgi:hypothetical protein
MTAAGGKPAGRPAVQKASARAGIFPANGAEERGVLGAEERTEKTL